MAAPGQLGFGERNGDARSRLDRGVLLSTIAGSARFASRATLRFKPTRPRCGFNDLGGGSNAAEVSSSLFSEVPNVSKSSNRSASADAGAAASGSLLEGYSAFSVLTPALLARRAILYRNRQRPTRSNNTKSSAASPRRRRSRCETSRRGLRRLRQGALDYEAAIVKAKLDRAVSP